MRIFKLIISFLLGIAVGIGSTKVMIKGIRKKSDKYERLFQFYESWLTLKQSGRALEEYFIKNSIRTIAVYGYGMTGRALVRELARSDIKIEYIVDKQKAIRTDGICLYHPNDKLPDSDAMVITPLAEGREIKNEMQDKFSGKLLLIEDILYTCL